MKLRNLLNLHIWLTSDSQREDQKLPYVLQSNIDIVLVAFLPSVAETRQTSSLSLSQNIKHCHKLYFVIISNTIIQYNIFQCLPWHAWAIIACRTDTLYRGCHWGPTPTVGDTTGHSQKKYFNFDP
jgi:hypothetical protein